MKNEKNKFNNETIESFVTRNFEILKYRSFYISLFQILAPISVGVQTSEDIRVLDRKKLKLSDPTRKNVLFAHPSLGSIGLRSYSRKIFLRFRIRKRFSVCFNSHS